MRNTPMERLRMRAMTGEPVLISSARHMKDFSAMGQLSGGMQNFGTLDALVSAKRVQAHDLGFPGRRNMERMRIIIVPMRVVGGVEQRVLPIHRLEDGPEMLQIVGALERLGGDANVAPEIFRRQ